MMCGMITEEDFEAVDQTFPGIVRYYLELKDKPRTFLELLWSFTHHGCACQSSAGVATVVATYLVPR